MKEKKRTPFELYMDDQIIDWETSLDANTKFELLQLFVEVERAKTAYDAVWAVTLMQGPLAFWYTESMVMANNDVLKSSELLEKRIKEIKKNIKQKILK